MAADSKQAMGFSINAENKGSLLCRKNLQSYFSLFEVLKVGLLIRSLWVFKAFIFAVDRILTIIWLIYIIPIAITPGKRLH